ncbi:MAG: molybdopterin dinucleotide binding domain-containing protein, partial [Candidatus Solibacter sp.]
ADPAEVAGSLAGIGASNSLRERADAIHKTGLGIVTTYADGKQTPVKDLTSDNFWKAMSEGAAWLHQDAKPSAPPVQVARAAAATAETVADLPLMAIPANNQPTLFSPLMTKLYQESNLRLAPNRVALHPDDARAAKLTDNARAILHTRTGKCTVDVTIDASVPAGAVLLGSSPGIQDICGAADRAKVVRA